MSAKSPAVYFLGLETCPNCRETVFAAEAAYRGDQLIQSRIIKSDLHHRLRAESHKAIRGQASVKLRRHHPTTDTAPIKQVEDTEKRSLLNIAILPLPSKVQRRALPDGPEHPLG